MPFSPRHKSGRTPPSGPGSITSLLLAEARDALARGRINEALNLCEQALATDPDSLPVLSLAAELCLRHGLKERAETLLAKATRLAPDNALLLHMYGVALFQMDKTDAALKALEKSVERQPENGQAWSVLGASRQKLGQLEAALEAYGRATELAPEDADIWVNRSAAALRLQDHTAAETATGRALSLNPAHRRALAYRAIALTELNRPSEAAAILDYDRLVRQIDLSDSLPADDLQQMNRALADHISTRPDLTYEPILKATRGGSQTADLLTKSAGPVTPLENAVRQAVTSYIEAADPALHPYLAFAPRQWRLIMWGTLLNRQGRQAPHIHPGAWLSGVYYAALPPEMGRAGSDDGWIEFGRAGEEFPCVQDPITRLFEPKEGRMLLFPSYMFHRTLPFESDQPRISIAFDIEPVTT